MFYIILFLIIYEWLYNRMVSKPTIGLWKHMAILWGGGGVTKFLSRVFRERDCSKIEHYVQNISIFHVLDFFAWPIWYVKR